MRARLQWVAIAAAVVAAIMPMDAGWIERWFSTGFYPALQRWVTPASNLVPFALFDLLTIAAGVCVIVVLVRGVRSARAQRRWSAMFAPIRLILAVAATVYLLFLAVWGLNYRRVPMQERLVMDRQPPAAAAVLALGVHAAAQMNMLHAQAHAGGWLADPRRDPALTGAFTAVQRSLSDGVAASPGRLKTTIYGPYFRWTGVDGMVNPFALEVLANPDLLPWEVPFVAAHEWAHLAGFADESEANFVGWLTCLEGPVAAQYSGWLFVYWQVAGEIGADDRKVLSEALDPGPRRDLQAIVERMQRGTLPLLRDASWRVYDQYLRANRVEEGVRSYGAVLTLILRARFEDGWVPVRRPARH
jgi:hypothetical protein